MEDIVNSLKRALAGQGWIYGEKLQRIGNPFVWVDGDRTPEMLIARGARAFLQYLTMFYEQYPTPETIMTGDYNKVRQYIEDVLRRYYRLYVPFLNPIESGFENSIISTALVRAQDYCALSSMSKNLEGPLNHLDIGPGLGTHAIYSLKSFDSHFYALEASPHSYSIQRDFFRFLSQDGSVYLDIIECENFDLDKKEISKLVNKSPEYRIKHVPSWYFDVVADKSIDLITATWVLNEVSAPGILWLVSHSSRVLRKGGYFYIRDSSRLKPFRHSIDYDGLLDKIGFVKVSSLDVRNRIDLHGIPRIYRKKTDSGVCFDELVEMCLGKFTVTAHGGSYAQEPQYPSCRKAVAR